MSLTLWPQTFWGQVSAALGLLIAAIALLRGPRADRVAALGLLANFILTVSLQDRQTWKDLQHAALLIDGLLFCLLLALAITCRRVWLGAAAAAQLLTTLTHLSIGLEVNALIGARAYHTAVIVLTFLMMLGVLADTVNNPSPGGLRARTS